MRETWTDNRRCELTFSHTDPAIGRSAAEAAAASCDAIGAGFTLREGEGGWRGERELSFSLAIVGEQADYADASREYVLRAIHRAGCEAVQVELWDGASYRVAEVRP